MTSQELLTTLQQQYSDYGSIIVSDLGDPSYVTVFDQLGLATTLEIQANPDSNWSNNQSVVSFGGQISTPVLELPAVPVTITFTPLESNPELFTLQMQLTLPASWTFGQSFPLLSGPVYNNIRLADPSSGASFLYVNASAEVVNDSENNPSLYFTGYIDQNSSLFTILFRVITGTIHPQSSGRIDFIAATGATDMQIPLGTGTLVSLFGGDGPQINCSLFLYSGLNELAEQYESGVMFETDITVDSYTVPLIALYSDSSGSTLTLQTRGLTIDFLAVYESLSQYLGNNHGLSEKIPEGITGSSLTIAAFSFSINIQKLTLNYVWLVLSYPGTWEIWPNVFELSTVELAFTAFSPFTSAAIYELSLGALTTFGNPETGLPLYIQGKFPALELRGSLYTDNYDLMPLITHLFGNSRGLPDDLEISELEFYCSIRDKVCTFDIDVIGDWDIPFGNDYDLSFRELRFELAYDTENGASGAAFAEFAIRSNIFSVEIDLDAESVVLIGKWSNEESPLDYEDIAIAFGMYGLPNIPTVLDLGLTEATFILDTAGPSVTFELGSKNYGSATLIAGKDASGNWGFVFGMIASLDLNIDLTNVDIIGNFVPDSMDNIEISELRFVGATSAIPVYTSTTDIENILGPEVNSGLVLSANLKIGTLLNETFTVRYGGLDDGTATDLPPTTNQNSGGEGNNPPTSNAVQLDTTPSQPAAMPGPTSAWINVQRSFGPVHISRIGFRITDDNALAVLLDAEVKLAGLTIGFDALEADIPVQSPYWPSFSLAGLEVGYIAPGLIIAGGLQKLYGVTPTQYTGELIIQAAGFGASAFGSYTTVNNEPSLFAFLALNVPLGGPPFFVVTGLSMGFGYNRRLILPTIENVQTYPLVQAAMGITDPQATINALNQYIVPADNQYWLAAGIRFTSFEMLNAYALLTVSFGTQVELALMGEAMLTLPLAVPGEEEVILAQADMVLLASITPSLGQLAISAQLTSRSYILDKNAQITGGFAFYFWFGKSKHAGDFVITLGGYNPHFQKPSYYPTVPQLGLNWKISNLISIKGGLYSALTPSVIMAGGNLQASYASGDVSASFTANADFLIRFKPFYFESQIAVSVSASYKLNLLFTTKKVTVTVGAQLNLWGPPFAGTATVDLSIFSFTIAFGAAKNTPPANIFWPEFRNSFLPPDPGTTTLPPSQGSQDTPLYTHSLIRFNADSGLISSSETGSNAETSWRVDPGKTSISIGTSVPTKTLNVSALLSETLDTSSIQTGFGIGPMGADSSVTAVTTSVTVFYEDVHDITNYWKVVLITEKIPAGLWLNKTNSMTGTTLLDNALTGIQLVPQPHHADIIAPIDQSQLLHSNSIVRSAAWSAATAQNEQNNQSQAMETMQNTITDASVENTRTSILNALIAQGLSTSTEDEISLDSFAEDAENILYAAPLLCGLGQTQF